MKLTTHSSSQKENNDRTKNNNIRDIQVAGVVFVILFSTLLVSNILISNSLKKDSSGINLAGRQRMLSQRLTKSMNALKYGLESKNNDLARASQKEASMAFHLFDDTLTAFIDGGVTTGAEGESVRLDALPPGEIRNHVLKASEIWQPIAPSILYTTTTSLNKIEGKQINESTDSLSKYNVELLALMNKLTVGLEDSANKKASTLKTILLVALLLVFINFSYIVFYALKSLKKRDKQLLDYSQNLEQNFSDLQQTNEALEGAQNDLYKSNESLQDALSSVREISHKAQARADKLESMTDALNKLQEESDTIFNSVDHGLCLLDKNHDIGQRVSRAMYDIFETEHISERSLQSLLAPLITEKDIKTLDSYLKLQFTPSTLSSQLDRYNPLKQIEITLNWDGKNFSTKHLSFDFERIMAGNEVEAVLVTITDVTETVALESKLQRESEAQERKTNLILEIIGNDANQLNLFLAQSEKTLNQINDSLKDKSLNQQEAVSSKELVEDVFRKVHNMKGNAAMIGLKTVTEILHKVEGGLTELRAKSVVKGEEFLSALVHLATLKERLEDYEEISQTILKDFAISKHSAHEVKKTKSQTLANDIAKFSTKLASDMGKKVFTRCHFEMEQMSENGLSAMKDVMIQMTRNSIVHGIELPEQRVKHGKLAEGLISLHCERDDESSNILGVPAYHFVFRDDGAGLDIEMIKSRALELGLRSERELGAMTEPDIAKLIFEPSFSTAESVDEHAGRGMGMDIIKQKIMKDLNGKLTMSFAAGAHMQLACYIPVSSLEQGLESEKIA